MAVAFQNFEFSYLRKGKPVFVPNALGRKIGKDIQRRVHLAVQFDDFFFHMKAGGHIAALHSHRHHRYFARVDIENFYFGIARNRIKRALIECGIPRATHYAKWSCVRNPYQNPRYSLPYGFVQSPILATIVLMKSATGAFIRNLPPEIARSIYMDDISLSADDPAQLDNIFDELLNNLRISNFAINGAKVRRPSPSIDIFNCDLREGYTRVQQLRADEFYSLPRSLLSQQAFEEYCDRVAEGSA